MYVPLLRNHSSKVREKMKINSKQRLLTHHHIIYTYAKSPVVVYLSGTGTILTLVHHWSRPVNQPLKTFQTKPKSRKTPHDVWHLT